MKRRLIALAAATAVLLSGCATGAGASSGETTSELTWGWALPTSWDPVTSTAGWDTHALSLVYAGLTQLDVEGNAVPALAEEWDYNEAGNEITFTLRDDLTFSDGSAVDAAAVKANLERGRDQSNSTLAGQLAIVTDVLVVDEKTVTVVLDQADYQVPLLFAGKTGLIVNPAAFAEAETLTTQPEGAGPFALTEYVPSSHAELAKNDSYWDADRIFIDEVRVEPVPDPAVAVASLQSGQFDVALVPPSQVEAVEQAGLTAEVIKALTVRVFDINSSVAPFDQPEVPQAISHAIDRDALIASAYFGQGTPNWQPFPDGYAAHSPDLDDLYPYDVDKAKDLLAEAGFPDGLDLTLGIAEADSALAEVIQAQLAEAGIRLTLKVIPPANNNYVTREYPFVLDSFSGRESPLQALEVLYGPEGLMNLGRTAPPEIAEAINVARATPLDAADYEKNVQAAVETAVKSMPNTFLFTWPRILAHSTKVTGIQQWIGTQRWEDVKVTG
jgi:peptide/nickel transport system substrate-binding protein